MSGWTTVTLYAEDEEDQEQLSENIDAKYGDRGRREYPTARGYAERTVQCARGVSHTGIARTLSDEFPLADKILVVAANDTSDSGRGTLLDVSGNSVEKIDSKAGYEGAMGRDVTGYFRDEHGVKGYATWEA